MKVKNEKKIIDALSRWTLADVKYASDEAAANVSYQVFHLPEMTPIEQLVYFSLRESGLEVFPQEKIGKYRVDFLLKMASGQIIIECDGHDFHEKTKEQAQNDKERDRALQAAGFKVYRFTGSEIWKTDGQCVFTVVDVTDIAF